MNKAKINIDPLLIGSSVFNQKTILVIKIVAKKIVNEFKINDVIFIFKVVVSNRDYKI
jgi:hypothetical protein